MSIGKVIRKYRKEKNMTQEEVAVRLGVTAPAVNKWENENSLPDIMLLAPIARLLGISLDTLLSFRDELTAEEINGIINELNEKLKTGSYEEAFRWIKEKLEQYPNCEELMLSAAVVLGVQLMIQELSAVEGHEDYIVSLYERALLSNDEKVRIRAADSLFSLYMRKERYDKAESYMDYFSSQNPDRKIKLARLYEEKGRTEEACKEYEELLFEEYSRISMALQGMYGLAMRDKDMERAHRIVDKRQEMARCFEAGRYHEVSGGLELALLEKDADAVILTMQEMLDSLSQIGGFRDSFLYKHMNFREMRPEYIEELRENLLQCFRDEETCGFLKNDERWVELTAYPDHE